MSIKGFADELSRGLKAPAYLLHGEDPYLLKEASSSLKLTIPEHDRDFLFHSFDADSPEWVSAERVIDVLYTMPLMGGRKSVVIENAQKLTDRELDPMANYISSPSPDSVLVMLNVGALKKAHKEKLGGAKQISLVIRESDIPFWITQEASKKGLRLTPKAVEYLIGTVGPDAGLLSSEIEKLTLCGKDTVDAEDVVEIVKGMGDYNAFDLIDALKRKDARRVFSIYASISATQEPFALLGALNWHFGRAQGSLRDKAGTFELLNEADTMLKSSGGAYPLEYLLVRLLRL